MRDPSRYESPYRPDNRQGQKKTRDPYRKLQPAAYEQTKRVSEDEGSATPTAMSAKSWASNFWITLADEHGETFYANPATGERKWELSSDTFCLPRSADGDWYELWSDEHNLPYYFHTATNETRWYKPDAFVIPLKAVQRFSAGKRFSLSFDTGTTILPDAPLDTPTAAAKPLPDIPEASRSSLEDDYTRSSDSTWQHRDPLSAALVSCMLASPSRSRQGSELLDSPLTTSQSSTLDSYNTAHSGDSSSETCSLSQSASSVDSCDPSTPQLDGREAFAGITSASEDTIGALMLRPHEEEVDDGGTWQTTHSGSVTVIKQVRQKPSREALGDAFVQQKPPQPTSMVSRQRQGSGIITSLFGKSASPKTPKEPSPRSRPHPPTLSSCISKHHPLQSEDGHGKVPFVTSSPQTPTTPGMKGHRSVSFQSSQEATVSGTSRTPRGDTQTPKGDPIPRDTSSSSVSSSIQSKRQSGLPAPLLADIQKFTLSSYAQEHFATRKSKGFFKRTLSVQDLLKWQSADLETPFLHVPKNLRWDALQCFTHLQHVMGDRLRPDADVRISLEDANSPSSWDHSTTEEAQRLLAYGIVNPELRDEIYVQLICQLTDNPSAISIYRGWQLMQVLLISFPPSPSLEPTLRQFLVARRGSAPKSRLAIIARYSLMKLDSIIVKAPRGRAPSMFEIAAASEGAFQPSVFGETIQRIMSLQSEAYPEARVPIILPFLADGILALGGLQTPGIFRASGDVEQVNELRIMIDQGKYSFGGCDDPHVAASLFKLWLRELAQPLVPEEYYAECMFAAESSASVIDIVQRLPSANRRIIAFVISFLQIFTQAAVIEETTMSASSLAMIFAPALFRCPDSGTPLSTVFSNARTEQQFVLQLLGYLDVTRLQDEDDWRPIHGKSCSVVSYSTTASDAAHSTSDSTSTIPSSTSSLDETSSSQKTEYDTSRQSLDSDTSNTSEVSLDSLGSSYSIASTRRRHSPVTRRARASSSTPTSPASSGSTIAKDEYHARSPTMASGVQDGSRDGDESNVSIDSLRSVSTDASVRYTARMEMGIKRQQSPVPAAMPHFIKPLIIVDEAD